MAFVGTGDLIRDYTVFLTNWKNAMNSGISVSTKEIGRIYIIY